MMVLMQAGTSGQGRPACIRGIMCLLASRRLPRGFSPGKPRPAQVRAGHLLLESARLARADCPRRGGFTRHEMRAHGVFPAMGTHPASAWSAGVVPAQTPQVILFAAFSRPLSRCFSLLDRPPGLGLWCAEETSSAQWTICLPPCTCRHGAGKRQGKVEGQVATTRIRKLSCCQNVIAPLSEEQDRYASCCPRGFWT